MSTEWTHDGLALDLARSREGNGESVVCPLSLGSFGSRGAADVAAVNLSRARPRSTIWEVKRTRSDFLADVRSAKYERYRPFCHQLYFAAPAGMLSKAEVPEGCGLVVRSAKGWSGVVAARVTDMEPGAWAEVLMAHLMAAHPGPWQKPTRVSRLRSEAAKESGELRDLLIARNDRLRALGRQAQDALREHRYTRQRVEDVLGEEVKPDEGLAMAVGRALVAARNGAGGPTPKMRVLGMELRGIADLAESALAHLEDSP